MKVDASQFSDTFLKRFWSRIVKTDACWLWQGYLNNKGYGQIRRGRRGAGNIFVHRASYILHFGAIPDETPCVLHRCDNPACVRPDHLFAGTQAENLQDMDAKGRSRRHFSLVDHAGEKHPRAKLNWKQIHEIRESKLQQRALGKLFGIHQSHVGRIKMGESWA